MTTQETHESPGLDPSFVFNPMDPAFVADPYPTFALLRSKAPVYSWPLGNSVLLTKWSDINAALRDPRLSTNAAHWDLAPPSPPEAEKPEIFRLMSKGLLLLGPRDHARVRRLVGPAFTAKAIEQRRAEIERVVNEAIEEHGASEAVDIAQIADFIPLRVISRVLGIPGVKEPEFRRFGASVLEVFDPFCPPDQLARLLEPLDLGLSLVRDIIAERRKALGDDLLSDLIRAEEAGDRLSSDELLALVAGLIMGGAESTVYFISFGVLTLLRHPDALEKVKADPSLLRAAIEEILRFESFMKLGIARYALEDIEIRGVPIPKGKMIIPLTASANRDPDVYQDADVFDIQRGATDHLSFGAGPHLCLGASLARFEAEIAIGALLRRFPAMRLAAEPTFGPHAYFRKITSLRVDVAPRG